MNEIIDCFSYLLSINWPPWISAIATVVSASAAMLMWKVSKNIYKLQESIEEKNKPLIYIWSNTDKKLTLINISEKPLALRDMNIVSGYGTSNERLVEFEVWAMDKDCMTNRESNKFDGHTKLKEGSVTKSNDIIFPPHRILWIRLCEDHSQFTIRAMNYAGEFEIIPIDMHHLGPYKLTGKGKRKA